MEMEKKSLQKIMMEKEMEVTQLKDTISAMQNTGEDHHHIYAAEYKKENVQLKIQISEMETFLNDYGLAWIGDNIPNEGIVEHNKKMDNEVVLDFDVDILITAINKLNTLAGEGTSSVKSESQVHRLTSKESIPFTIFRNGIMIRRGPFRPYSSSNCLPFLTVKLMRCSPIYA